MTTSITLAANNLPASTTCGIQVEDDVLNQFVTDQRRIYFKVIEREAYLEALEKCKSFEDLQTLFTGKNYNKFFAQDKKFLNKVLSIILSLCDERNGCSSEFLDRKITLFKSIIQGSIGDNNNDLTDVACVNFVGLYTGKGTAAENRRLRLEFINLLKGSEDILSGLDSLEVMGSLLSSSYTRVLPEAIGIFENSSLVENILQRAFTEDYDCFCRRSGEIITQLDTRDLDLYPAQAKQYANVVNDIKKRRDKLGKAAKAARRKPTTVEVLSVRPLFASGGSNSTDSVTLLASDDTPRASLLPPISPTSAMAQLGRLFLPKKTNPNSKIVIDTSRMLPSNEDIVLGLNRMIDVFPAASPIRQKLEGFLVAMPQFVDRYSSDQIKQELVTMLKSFFPVRDFNIVNLFGSEYSTLKNACSTVRILDNQFPNLDRCLGLDEPATFAGLNFMRQASQYANVNLDQYIGGDITFVQVADLYSQHFAVNGMSLDDFIKGHIIESEKRIQRNKPGFTVELNATQEHTDLIAALHRFLQEALIRYPERNKAISLLNKACEEYFSGELNDQTFLPHIEKITNESIRSRGCSNDSNDIFFLLSEFLQQYRTI